MNQLLTPEDSKRVADALIAEIRAVSERAQISAKYTLPDSVERSIKSAIQNSLGYSQFANVQGFQLFLADVKAAIYKALKQN